MDHQTEPRGYHHGDARNALIKAASDLLETAGAAGLSLRQVAERAGLSRHAPYNHFDGKEALLAELVRDGFERLAAAIAKSGGVKDGSALEKAGAAYIRFAQSTPALFRLMFSSEIVDRKRFPAAQAAATSAFTRLAAVVATFAPEDRVGELSTACWCMVHGYATLSVETRFEPEDQRTARARLFAEIIMAGTPEVPKELEHAG